ncbi:MAG: hypothetical protein RL716_1265 [Actinomycetota bacterium]
MSFTDAEHLIAAEKAHAEAKAVLPIFERVEPDDHRPRLALETLVEWMKGEAPVTQVRQLRFAKLPLMPTKRRVTPQAKQHVLQPEPVAKRHPWHM